jgi:predicted porin
MLGFFDDLEYGSSLIHLGYQQRKSSTTSTVTGITGEEVENTDISAGASYDPGNWFVKTEWIQRRSTYKKDAMYISAGYRVNKFTPYVTHSQNSMGSLYQNVAVSALNTRLAGRSQSTNSVGVRWDFMRNYDFKLQYDRVTLGDYSNGYLVNVPSNIKLYGTSFHVISAVVDFVF